ncbi:Kinase [Hexamita inflata]|uniref:Kinase n=1 Tax=Hexamita inflata TaxID=28002 RepID=A0AA86RLE8_9EUKA|nr:Kinase [Hexamita inflata]
MDKYEEAHKLVIRPSGCRIVLTKRKEDGKHVVIKQIPCNFVDQDAITEEAKIIKSVPAHPYIIKYLGDFRTNGVYNMVMEFANGGTLFSYVQKRITNDRIFTGSKSALQQYYKSILKIFYQVAQALDHLHTNGIIHRDVQPANIMLHNDNKEKKSLIKLIDFGCSTSKKYAQSDKGTLQFMAPEVIQNKPYSYKSDVYSLGCSLYFCVTGREPFQGRDAKPAVLFSMKQKWEQRPSQMLAQFQLPETVSLILDETMNLDVGNRCDMNWVLNKLHDENVE